MLNLDFAATFSIVEFNCFTVVGSKILASHIDVLFLLYVANFEVIDYYV